ncbi:PEP-CTERM sorting domain-containing protein [Pseudoduganella violacea]|uniref:Ice-binding protein C-terminal domain-containing protein n=1 Tax=Pseudoduganella violacea TaxID=1715466 RepID=A0A7W5BAC4_9BURK|nr:PEP-CTERM sorting domain-containing protein [Pseudoduganella violacea]MBB3119504.1 hypothetical protein [Pseudoduganella violacea]
MKFVKFAVVAAMMSAGAVQAGSIQLLSNGSFETGNLNGWTTSGLGSTGTCAGAGRDWNVAKVGSATGCSTVGNPIDGSYAAYVMNDGTATTKYTLAQNFFVPQGLKEATLSWSDSIVASYSGQARSFKVDILQGATLLGNVFSYDIASETNMAWDARSINVSALLASHQGQNLTLRFSNYIPQTWTGAAGLAIDNVSLSAKVPEPSSLLLVAAGLLVAGFARRRCTPAVAL